jgi:cytochrome P450
VADQRTCPFDVSAFDPLGPGQVANPYDTLALAREQCPVFEAPSLAMWCVTRWSDVQEVLANTQVFSSADMVRVWPPPPETAGDLPDGHPLEGALVSTDPPGHDRVRRLAHKAFTPAVVAAREPAIRKIANALVDGFIDRGEVNLAEVYCNELPPAVVAQLLGVPPEDSETFRRWALDAHDLGFSPPHLEPDVVLRLSREMVRFDHYVRDLIAARRQSPQDDLTSYLVHVQGEAEDGEPNLTDKELVKLIVSIVTAGSDTTSSLIGHTMYVLLSQPEVRASVMSDRTIVPAVVEEALRLYPSARAMRRTVRHATVLRGADIPEGASMFASLAAANRDPEVFANPDSFDFTRRNVKRHLSFGAATHFCLGAHLARLEAQVAIETLVERIPTMCLSPGQKLTDNDYEPNIFIPSLKTLHVRW